MKAKNIFFQAVFITFYPQFYLMFCRICFDTKDSKNDQPYAPQSLQLFGNSTSLCINIKRNNRNTFAVTRGFIYTSHVPKKFSF